MWRHLFKLISLHYFFQRPLKVLLTILGMAAGIAVFAAIEIANQSILFSFQNTLERLNGQTDLTIYGKTRGLTNDDYLKISQLPKIKQITPILKRPAFCPANLQVSLKLWGIEPLSRAAFFSSTPEDEHLAEQFMKMMGEPNYALFPKSLAEDCQWKEDQAFPLVLAGSNRQLSGSLYQDQNTSWEGAGLVFVDIATAQELLDSPEELSQIELQFTDMSPAAWLEVYGSKLPQGLAFQTPKARFSQGKSILKAFQFNLLSLGLISIFVAVFIVYNAASLSVLYRRSDLGMLRSLGATRRQVSTLFFTEVLGSGLVSSFLGILLGWFLSKLIFAQVLTTVSTHYLGDILSQMTLTPRSVLLSLAIGLGGSALGTLIPLYEVFAISPSESIRKLSFEKHLRRHPLFLLGLSLLLFGIAYFAYLQSSTEQPTYSFVTALASLLGCLSLTPLMMQVLLKPILWFSRRLSFPSTQIASVQISENAYRYSVVTAALALALALWIGIGLMVSSFRQSVVDWIHQSVSGDIYITLMENQQTPGNSLQSFIPQNLIQWLEAQEEVAFLDSLRSVPIKINQTPINATAIELNRLMQKGDFQILAGSRENFQPKANFVRPDQIAVAVSETLANRSQLKLGQSLSVPSSVGTLHFKVGAILYDYSSDQGMLYWDRADFLKRSSDPRVHATAVFLKDPQQASALAKRLQELPNLPPTLEVRLNQEMEASALRVFDQTFQVTQALRVVALVVAFLGVLTTLALLMEEKRREIGLLQSLGMSPLQMKAYGWSQGLLIAWIGYSLGLLTGILLCWIIIRVIHYYFFAWTIFFHWDFNLFLQSFALTLLTGSCASLWGIFYLRRLKPAEALRFDE